MTTYIGINDILLDALNEIPEYKSYFVSMYVQRPTGIIVKFNPILNEFVREFAEKEPDYFDILDEFINIYMAKHYNLKSLSPNLFHRLICLCVIIPNLIDFLQKRSDDIAVFKTSQHFLKHASSRNVPKDFYPHLAFILLTDEMSYRIKNIRDQRTRDRLERQFDALRVLAANSFMVLTRYTILSRESFSIREVQVKPTDIIQHKNRTYGVKLFEGNNATVNIIIADRGCGKTIALQRMIYAINNMGYTVIVFGNDTRNEFRFASFPLSQFVDENMYKSLSSQGEKAKGLDLTIYCDNPKYPIEKPIGEFKGTPKEWESLSGVVLFESEKLIEKVVEIEKEDFVKGRGRTKIFREHTLSRIINSFVKWRANDRTKKVALCINEAQNLIGSEADVETWGLFRSGDKLFTDIRGLGVPVVLNTQYISRIKKSGQQFDVLYGSLITSPVERKKLADTYVLTRLKTLLAIPSIKPDHVFFKIDQGKIFRTRFLVPPCMPENNKYSLDDLFGGKTRIGVGLKK